jgi:hypothetical protein
MRCRGDAPAPAACDRDVVPVELAPIAYPPVIKEKAKSRDDRSAHATFSSTRCASAAKLASALGKRLAGASARSAADARVRGMLSAWFVAMSPSRALLLTSLALGIVACGPTDSLPEEPEYCSAPTRGLDAGAPGDGMTPRALTLGSGAEESFAPWSDGSSATVLMGFQGGAMITPTLRVPALATEGETICLRVALTNTLSGGSTPFPELTTEITFQRVGDVFEAANLYDQLGFDASALRGQTLVLVVEVIGVTFTATSTVSLVLE